MCRKYLALFLDAEISKFPFSSWIVDNRFYAVLRRLDLLSGAIGFVLVLFAGAWPLVLIGFGAMAVGSGAMTLLLIPVERAFNALSAATVPVTLGLQSRRPRLLYLAALSYSGGLFALWCGGILAYFTAQGQPGALLPALIWSFSVAMAPFRSKDHFTPMLLPTHSTVARAGYLAMIVAVAFVPTLHFLVILSAFGLMMVGAAVTHGIWSRRITEEVLNEIASDNVEERDASIASLTLFPTASKASRVLIDALVDDARKLGYQTRVKHDATQEDVTAACLGAGAVIFDATREAKNDANYRRAMYVLNTDYAVTVSRNYLPANFPDFSPIAPPYPTSCDNDSLAAAAIQRLRELRGVLPRKPDHRGWRHGQTLMEHTVEKAEERRRREFNVFLSYRGRYEEDVIRLAQRHESSAAVQKVKFFTTGELALEDELLSLQRRWHVLRLIWRWIASASEFWVYDTDDYLDSWWTRGELILLALVAAERQPVLKVYDPATDTFGEPSDELVPDPDDRQSELMRQLMFFALQPEWVGRVRENLVGSEFVGLLGDRGELFDSSFTDDPLLQCGRCSTASEKPGVVDVNGFINLTYPILYGIRQQQIEEALADAGQIECPGCGTSYQITMAPPRFFWYPERVGYGTGPGQVVLEEKQTYRAGY